LISEVEQRNFTILSRIERRSDMSKSAGRIDLVKFRETAKEQREQAKTGPEGHTIRTRAVIRLVEDQLKEARVGEYTLFCDEAKSRRGGGRAPGPLAYFIAAIGF
jgi:hypothetical protein